MEIGGASGAPGAPDEGRLFTLEEANALVPRVRELFESIHERMERLGELQQQLEEFRARKRQGEHADGEAKLVTGAMGTASRCSNWPISMAIDCLIAKPIRWGAKPG